MNKTSLLKWFPHNLVQYLRSYRLKQGYSKFKNLLKKNLEIKNQYQNQRCFILGSGASIQQENITPLKNEIIFPLNNFYVHPNYPAIINNPDIPKFYLIAPSHRPTTEEYWQKWIKEIEGATPQSVPIIVGLNHYRHHFYYLSQKYSLFTQRKVYWYYTGITYTQNYRFKPQHLNLARPIWCANTASIYALVTAIYMGFSYIYLLGMDHTQILPKSLSQRFYQTGLHQLHENEKNSTLDYKKNKFLNFYYLWAQYIDLYKYAESLNIKIINCTKNSLLDIFPQADLKNILSDK